MANISQNQMLLLEKLRARLPDLEVRWSEERGVTDLLAGRLLPWSKVREAGNLVSMVLSEYGVLLGAPEVGKGYRLTDMRQDKKRGVYRARACQVVDDLPVYGATLLVFADRERGVYRIQSSFWREVNVTAKQELEAADLQKQLAARLREDPEAAAFEKDWQKQKPDAWALENFPLTSHPTLFLYRVGEGFHPVYDTLAFQPTKWVGVGGQLRREIGQVRVILDAVTGKILILEPTKEGLAYTDQWADGLSTLQDGNGNYLTRPLPVVQKDGGSYFMLNRLHTPEIRTYNAGGTESGLENKLKGDTDLSQDADGHWNTTTTSCTTSTRQSAQQPEVDAHFFAEDAWNFYHNLGWDGFDNGAYASPAAAWHCPVSLAAHIGMDANAYFSYYAEAVPGTTTNRYYGYLAFYDGYCDGTTVKFDFMAGDPIIIGHEYQHAITFFGAAKSNGDPGHLYGNDWLGGIREGFSDSFGCLRRGLWINPLFWTDGAVHSGANFTYFSATAHCQPFRRLEYPRSTNTFVGDWYCDHYDDRNTTLTTPFFSRKYFISSMLSHLAFLVGQGGLHQRTSRPAELIPVQGVGLERTAEIFLYALTNYFDTIPTNLAGETFIEAARHILDAAKDISGNDRTCEYVMMRRALYALGLYPYDSSYNKQTYGGEACMLPWAYAWQFSQPYLGLPALWWQSADLFINNKGSVEYDADVGKENKVFARVRNIGDQDLNNVKVKFYFSPMGTNLPPSIAGWHLCKNQAGTDCVLDIATLAAGSMNIADVNNPPANQAVNWYLDPAYVTPQVDHFCLRAVIECQAPNHNNDCPNEVQSNIQYSQPGDGAALDINFQVANWHEKAKPLDLRVTHTLPRGFQVKYVGEKPLSKIILEHGKPQGVQFRLLPPRVKSVSLAPPYDGKLTGELTGVVKGRFSGQLADVRLAPELPFDKTLKRNLVLTGRIAGNLEPRKASLNGDFQGELDPRTGNLRGVVTGNAALAKGPYRTHLKLNFTGCLEPLRAVHFSQFIDGEAVGGVTVQVKLPRLPRQCKPLK